MKTDSDKMRPRLEAEDTLHDLKTVRSHIRSATALSKLQKRVPRALLERLQVMGTDLDQLVAQANIDLIRFGAEN